MTSRHSSIRSARPAFTLVEVMISVALVLMIIYGVAKVFKLSTDAVGANQAIAAMVRDNRAAHSTFSDDMHNCVADSPLFIISSRLAFEGTGTSKAVTYDGVLTQPGITSGFLNPEEQRADSDGDPRTIEINGVQVQLKLASLSDRIPRLDRLGFCARSLYRRNTSADTKAYDAATSGEAFIWYGHTVYPRLHGVTFLQPNFQYASERILGRMCYLMKDSSSSIASPGNYPAFASDEVTPLGFDTQNQAAIAGVENWVGRYDLALATLDQWRVTVNKAFDINYPAANPIAFKNAPTWYRQLETNSANNRTFRPVCDPNVNRPLTSKKLAATAPFFVANCTQFVVEYAGDFLNQDPADGSVTDVSKWIDNTGALHTGKTDGQIDYIVDKPDPADPKTWSRRIRWYGLPRDTTGPEKNGATRIDEFDVVPLRDAVYATYKASFPAATFVRAQWETEYPGSQMYNAAGTPTGLGFVGGLAINNQVAGGKVVTDRDYTNADNDLQVVGADATNKSSLFRYVNAWHNDSPAMVRIVFKVNDPSNRVQNGQWFEYVLSR